MAGASLSSTHSHAHSRHSKRSVVESPVTPSSQGRASTPSGASSYYIDGPWEQRNHQFQNVLLSVSSFILILEFAERVSYYGINQGLKNFMGQNLGWTQAGSNSIKSTWTSICYLTPVLGGYIADEKWGRFKTLWVFGIWYTVGAFLVTISAHPSMNDEEDHLLANFVCHIGLFVGIAVGTGAIKANVITFGADQFDPNDPNEVAQSARFFSYINRVVNLGAIFSYGYLSVLCVNGSGAIPKEYGYFATFAVCGGVMVLAYALFAMAYPRYVHFAPEKSALSTLTSIVNGNCEYSKEARMLRYGLVAFALAFPLNLLAAFLSNTASSGQYLSYLVVACCLFGMYAWIRYGMSTAYMDKSKASNGGRYNDETVDDIKMVIRVLPFACFMIMWECAYDQLDANFQSIAQQCDLRLTKDDDEHNVQVPGASLSIFDPLTIIVLMKILDKFIYPLYQRIVGRPPGAYGKVLTGLIVAMLNMFWAGTFEVIRRNAGPLQYSNATGVYDILDTGSLQPMNNISWGYAVSMYVFTAVAECLINITAFELLYSELPVYLQGTCQVIVLFMVAMGSNLTSTFTLLFQGYITENLNDGHFEYMYYTLSGLSFLNIIAFVVVMQSMEFGVVRMDDDGDLAEGGAAGLDSREMDIGHIPNHHSSFESISLSRW
uniref:Major facilitator superfamily (MFS) profile domain-containing protein n=1 Tax=Globisporangium ultimum (strain ATCC 200006 / CBS 805.95 / DAOM BR144) TaxID=431595 RepID=K3WH16_GLOUD